MSTSTKRREDLSIIVVDDMKFNCEFIRKGLRGEGYSDIRIALGAGEALAQLEERPAEVLIADWVMPDMDGLALTDRVRQIDEEQNRYTCVILLTGRDDAESIIEAFERGVDDYLTKPPIKQELAARVYAAGRIANMQNGLLDAVSSLRDSYQNHVTIDPSTGLGNRLDAERRLGELLEMVESRGGAACCALFRISDSEGLRQQYGESIYDEIVKSVATRLRRVIRPTDVAARISESEFAIGMYYQDETQIRVKTFERIMQTINLRPVKTAKGFISISGAMAVSYSRKGHLCESVEELMESAVKKIKLSQDTADNKVAI